MSGYSNVVASSVKRTLKATGVSISRIPASLRIPLSFIGSFPFLGLVFDLGFRLLVADRVHHVRGLEGEEAALFDLHAGVGDPLHDHALYIKVGLVPGDGGAYFLPRIVGPAKALELLLTVDFVDAEEALRMG